MNQNIFGIILFSFIVGTAIFVSELFVKLPTPPSVFERPITYTHKYSCSHQKRTVYVNPVVGLANVKVTQALLNEQTNQLHTNFSIKKEEPQTEAVGIALHFFVKNGRNTQYLATESITVKPDFDKNGRALDNIVSSFQWLDDLKERDNLYVIAESSLNFNKSRSVEPMFDPVKATSVLLLAKE